MLSAAPASPLAPEMIVVQSLGMRRWLSLELARQLGVTMNVSFPFPAEFVQRVFAAAFPKLESDRAFDRAVLPWRILALFPEVLGRPGFEDLARYTAGEISALKQFQLASKIAAVFDRYLAYRPELILRWQDGGDDHWQAQLWRELARGHELAHAPALARRLQPDRADLSALPARLAIFGISTLPPFYLQLFGAILAQLEVHFFLLDPTPEYWGDIVSARERDRIVRREKKGALTEADLHLESCPALLASLGRLGRDFSRLVLDLTPASEDERFEAPAESTLLGQLQADIFHLRDRAAAEKSAVLADDRSVQIHCCHSPTRELEVLHDQLLALFAADPTLQPRDILVTMPDVETYAPLIEAVFGAVEQPALRIPFSIADRSARSESSLAEAFLQILDLVGSRFGAGRVLALLEVESMRRRFDLTDNDLPLLRTWLSRTGIRWGIDAAHRVALGLTDFDENTWRAGLRRLLLGYALPGDEETLFQGTLPVPEIEGGLALVLGGFVDFAESLFEKVRALETARPLGAWAHAFRDLLQTFFDDHDESADAIRHLRAALDDLENLEQLSGHDAPVEFDILRAYLAATLADSDSSSGFLTGRLTFCALKPMRSIPFKVICLLGLDDGKFPRRDAALAFDLAATQPRVGDRSLRDDDRHLFLETLLSARDTLYLSYCGLSARDNRPLPPSVLISELLDYLHAHFELPPGFVTQHRLQPFSPAYFAGGGPLFSYSAENCRASQTTRAGRHPAPAFAARPLPEPGPEWREVEIDRLANFFCYPTHAFVRDRLGIRVPEEAALLEECEPLEVAPLLRTQLQGRLARIGVNDPDFTGAHALLRAGGELPAGYVGDSAYRGLREKVTGFAAQLRAAEAAQLLPPLALDLPLGEWRITGVLQDLRPDYLLRARASDRRPADLLRAWVLHLALNAAAGAGYPRETLLLATDQAQRLIPVENASAILDGLLALYGRGLRLPLPFFPRASYEYADRTLRPGGRKSDPVTCARRVFFEGDFPERDDPRTALCFAHTDPLDDDWAKISLTVFEPLFAHLVPADV